MDYEQISFLDNNTQTTENDAINSEQIDRSKAAVNTTSQRNPYQSGYQIPFTNRFNRGETSYNNERRSAGYTRRIPNYQQRPNNENGNSFAGRNVENDSAGRFTRRLPNNETEGSFVRRLPNKAPEGAFVGRTLSEDAASGFTRRLPNKAFDQEYMTEWFREVKFLHDKGIRYVYVKKTPDYGVSQFKYKKTPELFAALLEFYTQVTKEQANIASVDEAQEALKGTGIEIRRGRNGEVKFVKTPAVDDRTLEVVEINKDAAE